jgi:hypothetical protein
MSQKTFCDWCGQQMNTNPAAGTTPILSIAIQAPAPMTSPNLCNYDCAQKWLAARKAKDIANRYTPTPSTPPDTPVTPV